KVKGKWLCKDESLKPTLTESRLQRLRPLISNGTVTVGNSCMKNDGAGLALIMDKETAIALGLKYGMVFKDAVTTGVDPTLLGIGPVPAVSQLLKKQQLNI
ncbi:acetyl-CoA C-acyltransferase, partial [Staphylococcus aureus]|nr:acetyl-CoA C-acyltransferase [Staphylococcus aureus]